MTKKNNTLKNLLGYLPVATLGIGLLIGGVRFQLQAEQTKTKVEEVKVKVEKLEEENGKELDKLKNDSKELDKKIEVNQTKQEEIDKKVEQINIKTDKIVELLLEIKQKKK